MNKFKNLYTAFSLKNFVAAVMMFVLLALAGHFTTAQAQGSWKLKEIRVINKIDGKYGTITSERYDATGGYVDIQISGDVHSFCPGGFEKLRFSWEFAGGIVEVATGGGVSASLRAGQISKSQHCRNSLAASSYMEMRSPGGSSSRYFSSDQISLLDERFETFKNPRVFAGQGEQNGVAAVKVKTHRFDPKKSWAYFEVYISTPTQEGGGLWYVYLYENTGSGNSTGGITPSQNSETINRLRQWVAYYENLINQWTQYRDQKVTLYYNHPTYYRWARAEYQKANQAIGSSQQYKVYYQNLLRQAGAR